MPRIDEFTGQAHETTIVESVESKTPMPMLPIKPNENLLQFLDKYMHQIAPNS